MNRFRAWDADRQEMHNVRALFFDDDKIEVNVGMGDTPDWRGGLTLRRPTELRDKNGKEIFEGDVYKEGKRLRQVVYASGSFMGDYANGTSQRFIAATDIEIIGNIYENPELCGDKETPSETDKATGQQEAS